MLFCTFYNVDAENYSVKYAPYDTWGLLAAHISNTLALWQNSRTCMPYNGTFSTVILALFLVLLLLFCYTQKKEYLTTFVKLNHALIKKKEIILKSVK